MDPQAFIRLSIGSLGLRLEDSDLKALLAHGCFYTSSPCLEIVVFTGTKGISNCGVGVKRQQLGTQESGKPGVELHLRVNLDPDPIYVFQFEDEAKLSPQTAQLQGTIAQPRFSCKFSQDSASQGDPFSSFWSNSGDSSS
ncbi:hypothetical protein AAHA92_23947 [Salvia divinorum]|uniref:Uncharacterized protein n=1 Tax=Salvia divinorum TaxID=28513 RepID=A0ABD1GTK1_SALDI